MAYTSLARIAREVRVNLLLFALLQAAQAACPASAASLEASVDGVRQAWEDQDASGLEERVASLHESIGCLEEPLTVTQAKGLHQVLALYFAHHHDQDAARDALLGAMSLDGSYAPPPAWLEAEPVLDAAFEAAQGQGPGDSMELPEGSWVVDGRADASRLPTERSSMVQRLDPLPATAWYVFVDQVPAALLPRVEVAPVVSPSQGGLRSRPLLYGGLAGLAVAAGGLSWAELHWKATMDGGFAQDEAEGRYRQAHNASVGSLALGVAGTGLVVGAVVIGRW
jgi:hypothetical protein